MDILALDIGGSKLMAAAVSLSRDRVDIGRIAHRSLGGGERYTTDDLVALIDDAVSELGTFPFERIGATIPGLADPQTGMWLYASYSGIRNFPIANILSARYGNRPVSIENDVNACALAEKMYGICRDVDNYLWMTVSNGIGGGLVLDGKPYQGYFGNAAEVGHFRMVEQDGFRCGCGNFGCLEAEAAGPGIIRRYRRLLPSNGLDGKTADGRRQTAADASDTLTARDVVEKAKAGDRVAQEVVETTGTLIGKALSYVTNLLNLQRIVLGGGVMQSFDQFYPSMEKTFQASLFKDANPSVRIEKSALGYNAALIGAASLTLPFGQPQGVAPTY